MPEAVTILAVVIYDQSDERTAERLRRAGLAVETVAPQALEAPVAGVLYLAPAERMTGAAVRATVASGAHLCLLPAWPPTSEGLLSRSITLAPATNRSGVTLEPDLTRGTGAAPAAHPLRILYRDQLFGGLGQPLATTLAGETVLAALPRASNRQGWVLATTLLLGTPSAQTTLADVATLLGALLAWLRRVPVDRSAAGVATVSAEEEKTNGDERWPQIALLALALTLPAALNGDQAIAVGPNSIASMRSTFAEVAHRLGQPVGDGAFQDAWRALVALGVVSAEAGTVCPPALRDYLGRWQLASRLRRLRRPATGG